MMLMCGQSNQLWHYLAGKYPGRVGMLLGPSYFKKQAIRHWMPYALDNDAYSAYSKNAEWDEKAWWHMIFAADKKHHKPLWILCPDVVANREATIEKWHGNYAELKMFGWPIAFAVQDGMTVEDVPKEADVVFVGGTTDWKWRTLPVWARAFNRVHVGRVNELRRLWTCEDLGVESVDGSGWFRGTSEGRQANQVIQWLDGNRSETEHFPAMPRLSHYNPASDPVRRVPMAETAVQGGGMA